MCAQYNILSYNNIIKKIDGEKIKNILRSFEPENGQNLKNTQAEIQISWSYKKKTCTVIRRYTIFTAIHVKTITGQKVFVPILKMSTP